MVVLYLCRLVPCPENTGVGGGMALLSDCKCPEQEPGIVMQPESLEKWRLFRAEVLQDIAESAGKDNHGLKTFGEIVEVDEAAQSTPDALDDIRSGLVGNIS